MNDVTIPNLRFFDRADAIKEQVLFGPYLSTNLAEIGTAAEKAGGGIFLALVTANVAKRREAAESWRGKTLQDASRNHDRLREGVAHLPPGFLRDALEGKVKLSEFEQETLAALSGAAAAKLARKRAAISGVREHIRLMHAGSAGNPRDIPSDMIILQDGAVSFHTSTTGAKEFGRKAGMAFFHCRIDRASGRFFELPEGDCPGEAILRSGQSCGSAESSDLEAVAVESSPSGSSESLSLPDSGKAPGSRSSSGESEKTFPGE